MRKSKALKGINEEFIRRSAESIGDEDIQEVLEKADDIKQKIISSAPLKKFVKDASTLLSLVKDCWSGAYRQIPVWVIGAVVFALLYVLSPIDMIPDFIPVIGLVDDAAVLALCLSLIEKDIQKYQLWRKTPKQIVEA